ncbi:DNA-binding protein [Flavobacteriaceae bacterium Ap0902]|nr:DNA-binding protein [Flavobacteriaceae bacterium Ap0902]
MDYKIGDKVKLRIEYYTPLGYRVLINEKDEGLLFNSEVFQDLEEHMELPGYIKNIKEDGKIDVSLRPQGFKKVIDNDTDKILRKLEKNNGELQLSDKSSPAEIQAQLGMSKKAFKKAIGNLYRQKIIMINQDHIQLEKS